MGQRLKLEKAEHTHVGRVREENQDRITSFETSYGEVFVVADGMGGHRGGATAASMLVNVIEDYFRSLPPVPGTPLPEALREAVRKANAAIFSAANSGNPETKKMGSTVVLAVHCKESDELVVAHVGDSRSYLFREGVLRQITHDHSLVQRYIDTGIITEDAGRRHPDSGVLTRSIGQKPDVEIDVKPTVALREGDVVLLCTDGLCGYVDDSTIAKIINGYPSPTEAAEHLLEMALQAGGEDNVSLQLLQFGARGSHPYAQSATDGPSPSAETVREISVQAIVGASAPKPPDPPPAAPPVSPVVSPKPPAAVPKTGGREKGACHLAYFLLPAVFLAGILVGILIDHFLISDSQPAPQPSSPPAQGLPPAPVPPPAVTGTSLPASSSSRTDLRHLNEAAASTGNVPGQPEVGKPKLDRHNHHN